MKSLTWELYFLNFDIGAYQNITFKYMVINSGSCKQEVNEE